jgi:uncharacterized protein (DUF885 family)
LVIRVREEPQMSERLASIDLIAEQYVDRAAALDPLLATFVGIAGHDDEMPDLSADGFAARAELDRSTLAALEHAAEQASAATAELGAFLTRELLPLARQKDACGREVYSRSLRYFLGAVVDPEEAYARGSEQIARIRADQERLASLIQPGATRQEAVAILDSDPARTTTRASRATTCRSPRNWPTARTSIAGSGCCAGSTGTVRAGPHTPRA